MRSLLDVCGQAPGRIDAALAGFDFRRATEAVWTIVEEADRCVDANRPWELARAERQGNTAAGERLDAVLDALITACRTLAEELHPFIPQSAARITAQLAAAGETLPSAHPLFPRLWETVDHL